MKKGYIYKEASLEDKRSFYVLPTDKAVELTDKFKIKQTEYLKAIEKTIGENEFNKLIGLLEQALPILEKMKEE